MNKTVSLCLLRRNLPAPHRAQRADGSSQLILPTRLCWRGDSSYPSLAFSMETINWELPASLRPHQPILGSSLMCSSHPQSQGKDGEGQEMHAGCCRSLGAYGEVMLGLTTMCSVLSV